MRGMRPLVPFLTGAAFLVSGALPAGAENIRVLLLDNQRSVTVRSSSDLVAEGMKSAGPANSMTVTAAGAGRGPVRVRSGKTFVRIGGREYRGTVEVRRKGNGLLQVINDLDIEDYLKGVIAAEIPHEWDREALMAQAVASRTYAIHEKMSQRRTTYHILATVDSQVYLGKAGERPRTVQAVRDTRGQIILYEGRPIAAYYHSSCGGHTEDALELWGHDAPYLRGVDCDCQQISRYGLWEKRFAVTEVLKALRRDGYRLEDITSVEADDITPAGRVKRVVFRNASATLTVPSESLRAALGWSQVPSIFFEPEIIDGEVVFSGRGLGHGVGLCQWGAQEMARRGASHREILLHYYPGTEIGRR